MKIASFVRKGALHGQSAVVEHGIVLEDGTHFVDLGRVPSIQQFPADERFDQLLKMDPPERAGILKEMSEQGEPLDGVHLRPASPFCPLYLLMHGNAPMIFKRQGPKARRWQLSRLPYPRVRPWTSHLGHGEELIVPEGSGLNHGAELGVVIGKPAYRVPEEQVRDHIAGFTILNDGYLFDAHKEFISPPMERLSPYQDQALATLYKAGDGIGMMGPWITTAEEVGDHYDLLLYTRSDGMQQNRAWSGSYLMLAEFLIHYFSRFMTLPTGTAISLGAAGWDGSGSELPPSIGSTRMLEVEIERLGALRTPVRRVEPILKSPLVDRLQSIGLAAERPMKAGPAVWVLRSGYRESDTIEGIPAETGMCPNLYPPRVAADCTTPLILPPHATNIRCSVQLAAVIGERPVYHASAKNALDYVAGVAAVLAVRDTSLGDAVHSPTAYEQRGAYFMGCCGDGFLRVGAVTALRQVGALANRWMRLSAPGVGDMEYTTADYRFGLAEMITMVSRIGTLMPGDILSLGIAGRELALPADAIRDVRTLTACVQGLGEVTVTVQDERDPAMRDPEQR